MNELRELDRAIAVALGWHVERYDCGGEFGYSLVDRNGKPVGTAAGENFWFEHQPMETVSEWSADANAVIAVCAERGWRVSFDRDGEKPPYATIEWDYDDWHFVKKSGATPQEAGARALLAALTGESEATA